MLNGINKKDLYFDGNHKNNRSNCRCSSGILSQRLNVSVLVWLISIAVTTLFSAGPVFGQYTVQPLELKLQPRAGSITKQPLQIHSFVPDAVLPVSLKVVELYQDTSGAWQIFDADPNSIDYVEAFDVSMLSSCSQWISLDRNSIELGPSAQGTVEVTLKVPRGRRGFYGAGIIVSTKALNISSTETDVGLYLRYLVPVLVEISSRALRPRIELSDVSIKNIPAIEDKPATTHISVSVKNIGQSLSRIKPFARLWGFQDEHWRLITRSEFADIGIIPGATLNLEEDIMRPLPSGRYRIGGAIYVDGRPAKAIQKEMDFVGDESTKRASVDAPLDLKPKDVMMEGFPGSTRSEIMYVLNFSDAVVNIQTLFVAPPVLSGSAISADGVKAEELACPSWVRIEPQQFTLKSYEEKRVRIITEMPEEAATYPWHYALLGLYAHYPDGQMAGLTTSKICVGNRKPQIKPETKIIAGNPLIRTLDAKQSQFAIYTEFQNGGLSHVVPLRCQAGLVITTGEMIGIIRSNTKLYGDESGVILPFAKRRYSGTWDLSFVPDGTYRLGVALEYEGGRIETQQIGIQLSTIGDQREISYTQAAGEIRPDEIINIQW